MLKKALIKTNWFNGLLNQQIALQTNPHFPADCSQDGFRSLQQTVLKKIHISQQTLLKISGNIVSACS
jgi:hypothetical protein